MAWTRAAISEMKTGMLLKRHRTEREKKGRKNQGESQLKVGTCVLLDFGGPGIHSAVGNNTFYNDAK